MSKGVGCITVVIGIFIIFSIFSVSPAVSSAINDWIEPFVSRQTFKWLHQAVSVTVTIIFAGIIKFIILPYLGKPNK